MAPMAVDHSLRDKKGPMVEGSLVQPEHKKAPLLLLLVTVQTLELLLLLLPQASDHCHMVALLTRCVLRSTRQEMEPSSDVLIHSYARESL
jgi:hypothetical protein